MTNGITYQEYWNEVKSALGFPQALHALKAIALGTAWLLNTIAGVIYHAVA